MTITRMLIIGTVLVALLSGGIEGANSKRHKLSQIDPEFNNFPTGANSGESHGHGGGSNDGSSDEGSAYGSQDESTVADTEDDLGFGDGFDPRLPDPPCVWTAWSSCDAQCGGGVAFRLRRITDECSYGPASESKPCNTNPCPQDCVLADWTEWGCGSGCCGCNVPCGGGQRTRTRAVLAPALFNGACPLPTQATETCNTHTCPVDCIVTGVWSEWGDCTQPCEGGTRTRSRSTEFVTVVRSGESMTQEQCPDSFQEETCNPQSCPVDCLVSEEWTGWGTCSADCGEGEQTRIRQVVVFPQSGGENCLPTFESRDCADGGVVLPPCVNNDVNNVKFKFTPSKFPRNPIIIPPPSPVRQPQPIVRKPVVRPTPTLPRFIPASPALPTVDPFFCESKQDGPYAHVDCACCNDLIMCFNGRPIIKWCPPGEIFDGDLRKCVVRSLATNC